MTRADFRWCLSAMPRACVSRVRSASTLFSTSSSCSTSCDWRTRPDAKRVSCWPIMPAWRACSTSSRSARRPARSILPVAVRTLMRSSAAVSGSAISTPTCETSSCQRWSSSLAAMLDAAATEGVPMDMAIHFSKRQARCTCPASVAARRWESLQRSTRARRDGASLASQASPQCRCRARAAPEPGPPTGQTSVTKSPNVTTCSLIRAFAWLKFVAVTPAQIAPAARSAAICLRAEAELGQHLVAVVAQAAAARAGTGPASPRA